MARKEQFILAVALLAGFFPIYVNGDVVFGQLQYSVILDEEPNPGVLIKELTALDTVSSGDIVFSVGDDNFAGGIVVFANKTSNNNNLLYDVNLLVGPNVTQSTFDYDERPRVVILIRASNSIGETATTQVIVNLVDINDNRPVFQPMIVINVAENALVNKSIGIVEAMDADSGINGFVAYEQQQPQSDVFMVQPNGSIILLQSLDYETRRQYQISVKATDHGDPVMSSTGEVMIMVTDENDRNPQFDLLSYSAQVYENRTMGSMILQVSAYDGDEGINDVIIYSILDTSVPFTVNSSTGYIILSGPLDRENTSFYNFIVTASEMMATNSHNTTNIAITILDVNDNYPVFLQQQYNISINETIPVERRILTVTADDADEDENARTIYRIDPSSIINQSFPFILHDTTGEITVNERLDYETQQMYTFEVMAEDSSNVIAGSGSFPSTTTVIINLININDEYPQFINAPYNVMILEHSEEDSLVVTLNVTDRDIGSDGIVEVSITSYEDIFEIINDYEISVKNSSLLDYEVTPQYSITVVATDMGLPPLRNTSVVVVNVINENDNAPSIICQPVQVSEGLLEENSLTTIEASDADGDSLKFMINVNHSHPVGVEQYFNFSDSELVTSSLMLDYENFTQVVLSITVTDGDHISNCSLDINITDINDNDPVFVEPLQFTVREDTNVGSMIGAVNVTDEDSGAFAVINYSLNDTRFTINPTTGELYLARPLDYEQQQLYLIKVTATDNPGGSVSNMESEIITVTVEDANDNRPVFTQSVYTVPVYENASVFSYRVIANDSDTGVNAEITYRIQSSNVNITGLLTIDQSSGVISKMGARNFDRETTGDINLTVIAYDNGILQLTGTAQVLIILLDINEHPPVFDQSSYTFNVYENASINRVVNTISATDMDEGINAVVSYILTSSDVPFRLDDSNPGDIFVNGPLNREVISNYTLHIVATDGILNTSVVVYINVLDVNDNPPQFRERSYRATIREDVKVGSSLINISATDNDIAPNNIICYSILSEDRMSTPTEISINNRSGEVTVKSQFDYDQDGFEPTILTYIYATDNPDCEDTGEYFTDFVTFLLTVTDVNDNCPQFVDTDDDNNNSFVASVSEGSGMAEQFNTNIAITDADDGDFGSITLTTNSTDFAVRLSDQDLLIIEILIQLDREIIDNYVILINATDGGGCSSYINLTISLIDVNERPPVFNSSNGYTTNISEDIYQQYVVYTGILAEDMETDGRTIVMYRLQQPHPLFSINQTTGIVTVNGTIDREANHSFVLTIIAYEEAMPMNQSSTTTLTIIVDDVNDNAPVILSCSSDSVPESNIIGNPVLTVMADDKDVGELLYYIEDLSNTFIINVTTGVITANNTLDYEGVRQFNFTVTVSDLVYNVSEACSIMLDDVNDNAPQFTAGCCNDINITENTAVGTLLSVDINATDADSGSNGRVELSSMFSFIDKFELLQNGSIIVTGILDYETQPIYNLLIVATDMASPTTSRLSSNVTIVVRLKNENDNDPSFNSSVYEFIMNEHSPSGTTVGQVIVTDADGGPVTLTVLNGPFLVDSNGMVTSNAGTNFFDYDNLPIYYHFTIVASDEDGRRDTANVVVSLVNVNDHSPLFTQHYNTTLATGNYSSQPLLALVALDEDSSTNGIISYSIQSDNSGGLFQVNNVTGLLTVSGSIDMSMVYSLTVLAMDHGSPPHSNTTIVTVNVIEHTEDFHFVNSSYNINILENITVNDEILRFSVDGVMEPQYFLATNISHFTVNSSNGVLTATSSLDYDRDAHVYVFTVGAVSTTHSTALAMVTINLVDINDNAPVFVDSGSVQAYVAEGLNNATIYILSTVDADSTINSNTDYLIVPSNVSTLFSITRLGQLLLNQSLDRESASQYQLTITAYDIDIPSLNNTINITVNVLDNNDHHPVFTKPYYVASINEAANNGTKIVTVMATDQDDDINGDITFTIIDGDSGGHFVITNTKSCEGTIYTSGVPTDRELNSMINLTIQASDRGSPPHTNTTTVIITLLDINDNTPILNTTGPFDVMENVNIGVILTLSAYDEDLLDNGYGVVSYFLAENYSGLFSLNVTTGDLIITNTLDRETVPNYNVTIILRDTPSDGSQVNNNLSIVTINVVDVNDNDPQFVPITMPLRISEDDAEGMIVTTLTATDNDEGSNADVIITIVSVTPNNSIEYFRIEAVSLSGIANLIVNSGLNRELIPLYNIVVRATDMGSPVRSSVMNFNVLVTDVNDNAPVFTMRQFSFTVPEDVSIGTNVGTLSAIDLDDSTLHYGYESDITQFFNINEANGVVSVADTLDRETNSTYHFMARVSDGVREDTVEVVISVVDVNDNAPQFTSHLYNGSIMEDSLPSIAVIIDPQINATDDDQVNTPNSQVSYSLLNNDQGEDYFDIDRITARVVVTVAGHNNLDYETVQQFNLTVQAVDGGSPSLSSTATLIISIIDVNDNPPVFTRQQFTVAVTEEQPVNGMLLLPLTVTANDDDSDTVNGAISYSISAGNTDVFALNNESGQLFAISRIDAEDSDLYNLTVVARDGSSPYNSATASILIIVHDINDNAPQFNASLFLASVSETAEGEPTVEQYVTTLGITDIDRGVNNSKLSINILSDKFTINQETHHLFTKPTSNSTLDREDSQTEQFVVIACDQGVEQQCSNATVIVTLLDVNDNDPQFDQPNYTLTIRQSQLVGTPVGVFIAQDEDIGSNGELYYSLQANVTEEIFYINPITGSLMLNQSISPDFTNSSIELIITASDRGVPSRSGTVIVTVMIFEELGIVPVFNQSLYNASIIEGSEAGTHVVTVLASSTISNIQYFIDRPPIGFTIDINKGNITTTVRLSREDATSYSFSVRASNDAATGYSLVVVTVIDANDHSPQFENIPYVFSVVENNEISQLIDQITASDQDSGTNAELQYSIIRGNEGNLFYINPYDGSLYANQLLDREEMSSYIIGVMVTDMGMPPLNATVNVTIIILDENDNSPVIEHITVFSGGHMLSMGNTSSVVVIPEDHPPYTPFIQFNVTDPDEGSNGDFVYELQDDNFIIDRFQGELQNIRELDYESRTSFSLTIFIMDRGQQSHSIQHSVLINISDINDCTPDFGITTSSLFTQIREQLPNGTLIMNFTATDCDSGNNSLIQYTITDGNEDGHFTINNTGHLTANVELDREEVPEYTLVITAADLGNPSLSSSIELTIELTDINDNAPQFEALPQSVNVSESISLSSIVTTVSATDNDVTSTVSYSITSDVFAISPTGVITVVEPLDREIVSWYNVTITATDGNNTNVTQLIVIVEDVNDNSPVFSEGSCGVTIFIQEHVNNSMVHQVLATDADEGGNSKIVYSFINPQDGNTFALNSNTGQIYTRGSLDHEIQSIYNLDIRAEDQAISQSERRVALCTVFVEVEDINDNPPQFLQDMYVGSVLENTVNSNILTVSATDEDTDTNNNQVQYTFSDDLQYPGRFIVDPHSGIIRNVVQLDREDIRVYNMTVIGSNTDGIPSLNDTAIVTITVLDVNEFPPMFISPPNRVNVSEIGTNEPILQLTANDMDDNPNVVYSYALLTRISNSPFSLGSADGRLLLTGTLDFEQRSHYSLIFEVSDGERSSNTSIVIEVIDENDNVPYFDNVDADGFIHASVLEGESDVVIIRLIINDADTDKINTDSMIQLVSATGGTNNMDARDHFELDPLTGDLTVPVNMSLDREENDFFILNVTVNNTRPGVGCSDLCYLTSAAELLVTVNDINDNPPVFTRSIYNADITTTVGIGQRVVQVEATDKDQLFGPIIYELNIKSGKALNFFGIDKTSGEVVTQASFLNSVGENFTFIVVAKDNGGISVYHSAEATVTVIVLDNLQRVVITFQCNQSVIVPQANNIKSTLENITGYFINLESVEPHYERDRTTGERLISNTNFTDFVFYAVDRTTNKIVEGEDVIRILVNRINLLEDVLSNGCKVQSAQAVQELLIASKKELTSLQVVLIILAGLIGSGGLLMLCLSYRQRYVGTHLKDERYMADIFYGPGDTLEDIERHKITTRTENYEMVGEPITQNQPMIIQPYQDWSQPVNVEKRSDATQQALRHDNPLYESQEIRMEMFADMSETDFSEEGEADLLAAAIADEDDEDADELVTAI